MDGVILIAIVWLALAGIANFFGYNPGTKGLREKPYITKSGKKHTAEKYREEHIL
jgi:hypothetical protein